MGAPVILVDGLSIVFSPSLGITDGKSLLLDTVGLSLSSGGSTFVGFDVGNDFDGLEVGRRSLGFTVDDGI